MVNHMGVKEKRLIVFENQASEPFGFPWRELSIDCFQVGLIACGHRRLHRADGWRAPSNFGGETMQNIVDCFDRDLEFANSRGIGLGGYQLCLPFFLRNFK